MIDEVLTSDVAKARFAFTNTSRTIYVHKRYRRIILRWRNQKDAIIDVKASFSG
jgi:hypothetical protein